MKEKTKNFILVISFLILIIGGILLNCFTVDKLISTTERRKLKQFPTITREKILSSNFSSELEEYAMDQFVGRDFFRSVKTFFHFNVLGQKDSNGLFLEDGGIYKQTGELKEAEIQKATNKFKTIQNKFLKNSEVYYAIIPDKNYYLSKNGLRMDYKKLEQIMKDNLSDMKYLNLFPILAKEDYYKTDLHWKQENLEKVAKFIGQNMNAPISLENTILENKGNFYGGYYGQLGSGLFGGNIKPDNLKYLKNPDIENSNTFNIETQKTGKIYDEEKWKTSNDKYDYFVSGPSAIVTITNPLAAQEKELLLFRDSFGSSLAPLLLEGYSKITLIDIRYIVSDYLDQYIDFKNQDVLFLYNTLILNEASILK